MKKIMAIFIIIFFIGCVSTQRYQIAVKLKDGSTIYHRDSKIAVNKINVWIRSNNGLSRYKTKDIDKLMLLDKDRTIIRKKENKEEDVRNKTNPCDEILKHYMEKFEPQFN